MTYLLFPSIGVLLHGGCYSEVASVRFCDVQIALIGPVQRGRILEQFVVDSAISIIVASGEGVSIFTGQR